MFEHVGAQGKDYAYSVVPLLDHALMESREPVHRQQAAGAIKHIALGVYGFGCEDVLIHFLNFVWPNLLVDTHKHLLYATFEAISGLTVALGPRTIFQYVVAGLYHPAWRVREKYWAIYNLIYIYSPDAMTACYPRLKNEERSVKGSSFVPRNNYRRSDLEIFL